ncbi:MAG TPA: hypothetical protein VGN46_19995 [Luteibacter sp.]|jgi:hypothetical protein|uniref:DUF4304 domain-containing protein n=1 Tax=Luteibacter sp. TaxID=1886636 RepID=UPI002F3F69DD
MNDKKALKRALVGSLGILLQPLGFKVVASQQSFRRATPDGWLSLHLAFVDHDMDFDVVLNAAVRFDEVQEGILPESAERRHTATIGCEYGNLTGQGQIRWKVADAQDVERVAQAIFEACAATMTPFLEHYSDKRTVLEALRRNDATSILISPIDQRRARIVAFMNTMNL